MANRYYLFLYKKKENDQYLSSLCVYFCPFVVLWLKWNLFRNEERSKRNGLRSKEYLLKARKTSLVWPRVEKPASKILNDVNERIKYFIWTAGHAFNDATLSMEKQMCTWLTGAEWNCYSLCWNCLVFFFLVNFQQKRGSNNKFFELIALFFFISL